MSPVSVDKTTWRMCHKEHHNFSFDDNCYLPVVDCGQHMLRKVLPPGDNFSVMWRHLLSAF